MANDSGGSWLYLSTICWVEIEPHCTLTKPDGDNGTQQVLRWILGWWWYFESECHIKWLLLRYTHKVQSQKPYDIVNICSALNCNRNNQILRLRRPNYNWSSSVDLRVRMNTRYRAHIAKPGLINIRHMISSTNNSMRLCMTRRKFYFQFEFMLYNSAIVEL